MSVGTGVGLAIAGIGMGATAGAGIYAAHKSANATEQAANTQVQFDQKALDYQKEQDKIAHQEYLFERDLAIQRYNALQGRLEPYREAGVAGLTQLSDLLLKPQPNLNFRVPAGTPVADLSKMNRAPGQPG